MGVPNSREAIGQADAIVIALKTRSVKSQEAIAKSLEALDALRAFGASRYYFKYCSTFDSTTEGNIGPVTDALIKALKISQTIFCPAFPENARSVYNGHLFVGDTLLNESSMRHHPLTPMTDANLARVLSGQSNQRIGCVAYSVVDQGAEAIKSTLLELDAQSTPFVIVDALKNEHLDSIAKACVDKLLLTGSSGLAAKLPAAYRECGLLSNVAISPAMPNIAGRTAILSGSCSTATQEQLAFIRSQYPIRFLDVRRCLQHAEAELNELVDWAKSLVDSQPLVIASTAEAGEVAVIQSEFGRQTVASAVEQMMANIARRLVDECNVRRLIVAGGETSGAIVSTLGVSTLRIGPRIAISVPWTESIEGPRLALALKSGNFGGRNFFQRAVEMLSE
jgi:3-dehydrotetronate 4-kinase